MAEKNSPKNYVINKAINFNDYHDECVRISFFEVFKGRIIIELVLIELFAFLKFIFTSLKQFLTFLQSLLGKFIAINLT